MVLGAVRSSRSCRWVFFPGVEAPPDQNSLTVRQANFLAQQAELTRLGVDDYTRYCATLTADSESDFRNITHPGFVGAYHSEGIYGQTLPWWTNDHFDIPAATDAFVREFRRNTGDPVKDCWDTQHWDAPDYRTDPKEFVAAVETQNYAGRLDAVKALLATGALTE